MRKKTQPTGTTDGKMRTKRAKARIEQAEARIEQAKAQTEQARAQVEQAKAQTEQAKAQAEQAKAREEQAKAQAVQAQTTLQNVLHKGAVLHHEASPRLLKNDSGSADQKSPLEQLTERQREILRLIAEGQNTKQIAELLKVSPKTVEYHRMKLMAGLNLHDIPGLVRFAVKVGLITPDN